MNSKESLESLFFNHRQQILQHMMFNPIIVFHCEFSQRRGPLMYSIMRSLDRELNTAVYPLLSYPEIYVLQDGYSSFQSLYSEHCLGSYVKMADQPSQPQIQSSMLMSCNKKVQYNLLKAKGI